MTANPAATTTATCSASSSAPVASAPVMVRSRPVIGAVELAEINDRFETAPPGEIVQWAAARFGHRLAIDGRVGCWGATKTECGLHL